jgi:hypothetical protein
VVRLRDRPILVGWLLVGLIFGGVTLYAVLQGSAG